MLWAEMLNDIKSNPNYVSLGIAAAACTRSDEKPAAKFGQAVLSTRIKTNFHRDIIDAIKAMTEVVGDDAKRRAIRHNDMYDYLQQMGLDAMAQRFPDIPAFASNNNTKKYEEFEIPHPDRIKQISNNHLQQCGLHDSQARACDTKYSWGSFRARDCNKITIAVMDKDSRRPGSESRSSIDYGPFSESTDRGNRT